MIAGGSETAAQCSSHPGLKFAAKSMCAVYISRQTHTCAQRQTDTHTLIFYIPRSSQLVMCTLLAACKAVPALKESVDICNNA